MRQIKCDKGRGGHHGQLRGGGDRSGRGGGTTVMIITGTYVVLTPGQDRLHLDATFVTYNNPPIT